ncbi:MAG TPA: RNA polymerase sigma-70 factor [Jiangellaceae bacterium]|nr:RNA polymerase sigma-70 factor [Jiangellaceae bacterium]
MSNLATEQHDELRPLMFSIAYRMLGSVAEAEDIVQDAFVRMVDTPPTEVRSPEAYASTVTTRLAIDHLRSARVRREKYVGSWLPEPLFTEVRETDPAAKAELSDTLSMAFLVLLESLSPVERAVFLLREVFSYDYDQIASIVDKSEANCRQIFARARQRIADRRPRFEASRERREELARRFAAASESGDTAALEQLLAHDVTFYADGGGKAPAVTQPVSGTIRVARFIIGIARQLRALNGRLEPAEVNGQPGFRLVDADGRLGAVLELTIVDGHIHELRNVLNPDKLGHLGPLVDPADLPGRR